MMSIVRNCEMFCCETCQDHVRNGLCFDLTPAGVHGICVHFVSMSVHPVVLLLSIPAAVLMHTGI